MSFDSICLNGNCIKDKNAFFTFQPDNIHIINSHNVKAIHPFTFASYFKKQEDIDLSTDYQKMLKDLCKAMDQTYQLIQNTIKRLFYKDFLSKFQQELDSFSGLNFQTFIKGLKQGDYKLVKYLSEFEGQKTFTSFKNFYGKLMSQNQSQTQLTLITIKDEIIKICQRFQTVSSRKKPQQQQLQGRVDDSTHKRNQIVSSSNIKATNNSIVQQEHKPSLKYTFVKLEQVPVNVVQENINRTINSDESQQESEGQQQIPQNDLNKTKQISKSSSQKSRRRRRRYKITDQIELVTNYQIIIKESRYPQKTLKHLSENHPHLATINIFHERFATKNIITSLLEAFPRLQKIVFNCYYQFQLQAMLPFSKDILSKLKIQLKWDYSKFFKEYFAFAYFPHKTIRKRQRKKKIDISQMARLLPGNSSIWIYDNQSYTALSRLKIKQQNITTLHYTHTDSYGWLQSNTFQKLTFKNLQILNLKNLNLYEDSSNTLQQFIKRNKLLNTIIFAQCQFGYQTLQKTLNTISKLSYISKLSIVFSKDTEYQNISSQAIFNIVSLNFLNLERVRFFSEHQFYENPLFHIKNVGKLNKLRYLSLYDCHVFSDFLSYISSHCYNSLQFLNLGKTFINNDACQYLKKFTRLIHLNLDETIIQGDLLVDAFKTISRDSILDCPLKFLSLEKYENRININHLKLIGACLPKLQYLNIAFVKDILDYDFTQFKNLKTLAVDKEQFDKYEQGTSPQITKYKINQYQ